MAAAKPEILLLQLGDAMQVNLFDELYSSIQEKFEAHYIVVKKRNAAEIIEFLSTAAPLTKAILAVDGGLSKKKNKGVQTKLHQYAERGGTVLLCCIFSSFVRPTDFKVMSQNMSLGWEWGDYHRTVFALSPAFKSVFGSDAFATLETAYSMKAVHLKGVAPEAKIYVPTDDSRVQSAVFPPGKVDTTQCPAAFQKHRDGFVGFVGDVNNETGSQALIMAMLNIAANRTPSSGMSDEFRDLPALVDGCAVCGDTTPVKKCAGCKKVQYCSVNCQKDDWGAHKEHCRKSA